MKTAFSRRYRRRNTTARPEGSFFRKESHHEPSFFGEGSHDTFFKPAGLSSQNIQRSAAPPEEDKKVQRAEMKKEEEKVMKKEEKKEEEKVMKKEEKKEEEKIQKKEAGHSTSPGTGVSNYINSLPGKGQPLPANSNDFFSYKMGYDFTDVRIHSDKEAAESARSVNAKAYTVGNNVVFNEGRFNTSTSEGKKLMAHELTHVIQQKSLEPVVQRSFNDHHDLTSSLLSGDPVLEKCFDNEAVVGRYSRGGHVEKIQQALVALKIPLPDFQVDGKYGTQTIENVKRFQEKANMSKSEWDGIVGRKTIGLMDMSLRNANTIKGDSDKASDDFTLNDDSQKKKDNSCENKPHDKPCPDPNTEIDSAGDKVIALIDKVEKEQLPPVANEKADYPSVFNLLFRFNDNRPVANKVTEVRNNYGKIKKFIGEMKKDKRHVRCGTECDGGCRAGAPAYHDHGNGKNIITFCPDFSKHETRILVLLHECHHAGVPGSKDIAYQMTRLIEKLDHKNALLNAASFHLYAGMVDDPGSVSIGQQVKDKNTIIVGSVRKKVNQAIAFVEQWFRLVPFDISQTATDMETANEKGHYKSAGKHDIVHNLHLWFGTADMFLIPPKEDVKKVKAIGERTVLMEKAFDKAFNISESSGISSWQRGPGTEIMLNEGTMSLNTKHLAIALLQELIHATPGISAESEPLYAGLINAIRNRRSMDPK